MINKVVLLICLVLATVEIVSGSIKTTADCPGRGMDDKGYWTLDSKDGQPRCILRCTDGFVPDGCHVLRKKPGGEWNFKEPHCVECPVTFTGSATVAGSWFALARRAGATTTKAGLFSLTSAVTGFISSVFDGCEPE